MTLYFHTNTDVFTKGEDLPNGETYNGPDELYRLVTDEPSVPKPLRVLYQKECNLLPLETESGGASTEDADPAGEEENPDG